MKYDYLIIGQGLAGSILAYKLLKRGKSIAIIDERKAITSSKVAAGLVNPFTGPKMVKTWKAEELFPYLKKFYIEIENETKTHFFSERTIYRPLASFAELNDWDGRSTQPNYQRFIRQICSKEAHSSFVYDPFGGVEIHGFVLNVPAFLDSMHQYFTKKCTFFEEHFDEKNLEVSDSNVQYHGIQADKVVFCSGHQIQHSRFFGWIPLTPVKGEVLHLKMARDFKTIYNRSCFIIPQGNGFYKAGSTYNRNDLSDKPNEQGKNEISKKLNALLKMNYEIVRHQAGIRPASVARRPLIGIHPSHKNLSVFNGLGSKGVSLAPFFSDQLAKCLEEGNNVDEEVDIKKYFSLYFNSHFSIKN
jgi:glycine oxidase